MVLLANGYRYAFGLAHVAAIRLAAERLRELGDDAAMRGVKVLRESHDGWVVPAFLRHLEPELRNDV